MTGPDLPRIEFKDSDARLLAALLDLPLPPECEPGVIRNLAALSDHAAIVRKALSGR